MKTSETAAGSTSPSSGAKLSLFERYLSLWVGLCMIAGGLIGRTLPALVGALLGLE